MLKTYSFDYNNGDASVSFIVDTEIFTEEMAKATLEFFSWDYDDDEPPIDEVMKKYAMQAIKIATFNDYNEFGVISEFEDLEGFARIDGSLGIKLTNVEKLDLDDFYLSVTIST